jgi:IS5 family transposase
MLSLYFKLLIYKEKHSALEITMRKKHTVQCSIFEYYPEHETGHELKAISQWVDQHPELLDWVAGDVKNRAVKNNSGREGLTVESILRCAILKQYHQVSYYDLAFCLMDSTACQSFARLRPGWYPKRSVLQSCVSVISEVTWEQINQSLLRSAVKAKVERGNMLRIDSTVVDTPIHEPSDSSLLWDSMRVLVRLLKKADELVQGLTTLDYKNHRRLAKKRARAIVYTRGKEKKKLLYKDLVNAVEKTLCYLDAAVATVNSVSITEFLALETWHAQVTHYKPLIQQAIEQTKRRVFADEKVPASEKIVSVFEEHSDIIVKGSRDIQYGHKINISTGKSGLVLDVVIEEGNPADTDKCIPMLERHIDHYGQAPRQMAADGGYASIDNLAAAKGLNVKDMAFHKKRGLAVENMTKSAWVYRKLRNFRAGIEAGISYLKRVYGLRRCTWKGLKHFKSYVWSSIVAHNLVVFSRLLTT